MTHPLNLPPFYHYTPLTFLLMPPPPPGPSASFVTKLPATQEGTGPGLGPEGAENSEENGPAPGLGLGEKVGNSMQGGGLLSSFSSMHGTTPGQGLGSGLGGGGGGLAMVAALALQNKQADEVIYSISILAHPIAATTTTTTTTHAMISLLTPPTNNPLTLSFTHSIIIPSHNHNRSLMRSR